MFLNYFKTLGLLPILSKQIAFLFLFTLFNPSFASADALRAEGIHELDFDSVASGASKFFKRSNFFGDGFVGASYHTQIPLSNKWRGDSAFADLEIETRVFNNESGLLNSCQNGFESAVKETIASLEHARSQKQLALNPRLAEIHQLELGLLDPDLEDSQKALIINSIASKKEEIKGTELEIQSSILILPHLQRLRTLKLRGFLRLYESENKAESLNQAFALLFNTSLPHCEGNLVDLLYQTRRKEAGSASFNWLPVEMKFRIPIAGASSPSALQELKTGLLKIVLESGFGFQFASYVYRQNELGLGAYHAGEFVNFTVDQAFSNKNGGFFELVIRGSGSIALGERTTLGDAALSQVTQSAAEQKLKTLDDPKSSESLAFITRAQYGVGIRMAKRVLLEFSQGLEFLTTGGGNYQQNSSNTYSKYSLYSKLSQGTIGFQATDWLSFTAFLRRDTASTSTSFEFETIPEPGNSLKKRLTQEDSSEISSTQIGTGITVKW